MTAVDAPGGGDVQPAEAPQQVAEPTASPDNAAAPAAPPVHSDISGHEHLESLVVDASVANAEALAQGMMASVPEGVQDQAITPEASHAAADQIAAALAAYNTAEHQVDASHPMAQDGADLMRHLPAVAGADVASSGDSGGEASLEGNWHVGAIAGGIESSVPVSQEASASSAGDRDDAASDLRDSAHGVLALAVEPLNDSRVELLFVDPSVSHAESLAQSLAASAPEGVHVRIVSLDPSRDGLVQITESLAFYSTPEHAVDAIHLVTHADSGKILLGYSSLTEDQLGDASPATVALNAWKPYLSLNADILLYGCDVAEGQDGLHFIERLSEITGADVAASTDVTGAAYLGGNWRLEASTGLVETASLTSAASISLAPLASVTVDAPENPFSGETFDASISFSNTSANPADAGFGPFVELRVSPGLDVVGGFTYLGSAVNVLGSFTNNTALPTVIPHPIPQLAGPPLNATITLAPGEEYYVLELPFGMFAPSQPTAIINFQAIADKSEAPASFTPEAGGVQGAVSFQVGGGYRFGTDPLDNPGTDTPIYIAPSANNEDGNIAVDASGTDEIRPQIWEVSKELVEKENEAATGPNDPQTWRIVVDVADGETILNANLEDFLSNNLVYIAGTATITTGTVIQTPIAGQPNNAPDNHFIFNIPSVTGTTSSSDIVIEYQTYVPYLDANGNTVLNEVSGDDLAINNGVNASATYDADGPGPGSPIAITDTVATPHLLPNTETLGAKSLAIQKSVTDLNGGGLVPGDVLAWNLNFQVSDYFQFDDLYIMDRLSDGQLFVDASGAVVAGVLPPSFNWFENGSNVSTSFSIAAPSADLNPIPNVAEVDFGNFVVFYNGTTSIQTFNASLYEPSASSAISVDPGETILLFRISEQMATAGADATLQGDGLPAGGLLAPGTPALLDAALAANIGDGQTNGNIVFRSVVQENYITGVSGDVSLDMGDSISNSADINGQILNNITGLPGQREGDDSSAGATIAGPALDKSIFAVQGNTSFSNAIIGSGETITWKLNTTLSTADVEQLVVTDFVPLPKFTVTDFEGIGTSQDIKPDITVYDRTTFNGLGGAQVPPAGKIFLVLGDDVFTQLGGTLGTPDVGASILTGASISNSTSNSFSINVGTFDLPAAVSSLLSNRQIDVYFTLAATDQPMADGLLLTNQQLSSYNDTGTVSAVGEAIAQVVIKEPVVDIQKGIVASTQGGGLTLGGIAFNGVGGSGFSGVVSDQTEANAIGASDLTSGTLPDAGDTIRYAIVVQNTGRADAHDVTFSDTLNINYFFDTDPSDEAAFITATGFKVFTGSGVLLTNDTDYTLTYTAGTGKFEVELIDVASTTGRLAEGKNPDGTDITTGLNTIVVTYDVVLQSAAPSVPASLSYTNTASLSKYAGIEGGIDRLPVDDTETAVFRTAAPLFTKVLTSSEINATGNNGANQAVIGELVTYTLTITVPEGTTPNAQIVDRLAPGLAFVDIVSVTPSSGAVTANTIGIGTGASAGVGPTNVAIGNVSTGTANQLTFSLGDIVNTNVDNAVAETIAIVYRAVVLNANTIPSSPGNQAGSSLGNTADFTYNTTTADGVSPPVTASNLINSVSANVAVVEPHLDVNKRVGGTFAANSAGYGNSLNDKDAGDSVYFSIIITNDGTMSAYDISLVDVLPADLTGLTVRAETTSVGTVTVNGVAATITNADFIFTGSTLSIDPAKNIDLAPGAIITIHVEGTLVGTVSPGQGALNNDAVVRWSSMDGPAIDRSIHNSASDERDGSGATPTNNTDASSIDAILNNYAHSDRAAVVISNPVPVKTLVSTNVSSSFGSELVVGEVARYEILWRIPEGDVTTLNFRDNLPDGLRFLNDGTVTVAFIADAGASITSSTMGTTPYFGTSIGTPTTLLLGAGGTIADESNNGVFVSGEDVFFNLGTITNVENDANNEYIIIAFNAVVVNQLSNQDAVTLSNTATIRSDTANLQTSLAVDITVDEPTLTVAKSVSATPPVDAGDTLTYTITLTNASGQTAYDVTLSDPIDSDLNVVSGFLGVVSGSNVVLAGGATSSPSAFEIVDLGGGNYTLRTASGADVDIPVGGSITLTFEAVVANDIVTGDTVENRANVRWTSTNGANPDERGGTDVTDPAPETIDQTLTTGPLNNYALSSAVATTVINNILVAKSVVETSLLDNGAAVTPGEIVTYQLSITVPEGVAPDLQIRDAIPAGAAYVPGSVNLITTGFNGTVSSPAVTNTSSGSTYGDGTDILFDFAAITVVDDNNSLNNTFVITYRTVVLDVLGNSGVSGSQTVLTNTATNNNGSGSTFGSPSSANVTVNEPVLTIDKVSSIASGDAGDAVTYTVTIAHAATSTAGAYELNLGDVLPSEFTPSGFTALLNGVTDISGQFDLTGNIFTTSGTVNLLQTDTIVITFSGALNTTLTPNQSVVNTANLSYTNYPGDRTSGGGFNPNPDVTTDNERSVSINDPATITSSYAPLVNKSIVSTSEAASTGSDLLIGEIVRYQLKVELFEGTLNDLVIRDNLPTGLQFLNDGTATLTFTNVGTSIAGASLAARDSVTGAGVVFTDGTDIFFQLGDVVNNDNDANVEYAVIQFNALVLNTTGNQNGNTRDNNFAVLYDADNNGLTAPTAISTLRVDANDDGTPETTGQSVSNTVTATLREAVLSFNETIPAGVGYDAGDTFTITYTITNSGSVPAYNVRLADLALPAEFNLTAINFVTTGTGGTVTDSTNLGTDSIDSVISQIDAGATWTITATVTLRNTVNPSDAYTNPADVTFTSLPGANGTTGNVTGSNTPGAAGAATGERTGADGVGGLLNDYALSGTAGLSIPNPFIVTKAANVSTATIGDIVTYTVTVTVIEGTTTNIVLNDTLPTGMAFVANSAVLTNANGMTITGFNTNSLDQALTSVLNPGAVDSTATAATDTFTYTYQAIVQDVASNDGITAAGDSDGQTTLINDLDASGDGVPPDIDNQVTVTVIEPILSIVKAHDDADREVTPGQELTYTLVIEHRPGSTATAFDVAIRDLIPSGLTYVAGSVTVAGTTGSPVGVSVSNSGASITGVIDELPVGSTVTITYHATVNLNATPGANIDNNARVYWDTQAVDEDNIEDPSDATTPVDGGDRDYGPSTPGSIETPNPNADTDPGQDTERVTVGTGSIGDFIWNDLDGDGVQDALERGVGSVQVFIDLNDNGTYDSATELTATTDANGQYLIDGLAAGSYSVRVLTSTLPASVTQTYDLNGALDHAALVSLTSGQDRTDVDFGYIGAASAGDRVWLDLDGNGVQNALESGVEGVTIDLLRDLNGDGDALDAGEGVIAQRTTDASGDYLFAGMIGGDYIIRITDTANVLTDATNTYDLDDGTVAPDEEAAFALGSAQNRSDVDFGYRGAASLGDRIWNDLDADGVQDAGEFGVAGLTVQIEQFIGGSYVAVATTTTGADGVYGFSGLIADDYRVVVTTPPASSTRTYDLDGVGTSDQADRTLTSTEQATDVDFGYQGSASIGDYVWYDANNDGVQDGIATEPAIPGVRVYLDINGNGVYESLTEPSATTDANGIYSITGLVGGTYTAHIDISTLPAGYVATYDLDGNTSPDRTTFVLGDAANKTDIDFGYIGTLTVSGRSYHDFLKDGDFDGADTGLGGVTIELIFDTNNDGTVDAGDSLVFTTTTAADGTYSFNQVISGNYLIRETQLVGYGSSEAPTNLIDIVVSGADVADNDFGNTTGSIAGHVYLDMNDDGLIDPDGVDNIFGNEDDEIALEGVSITLTWSGVDNIFGNGDDRTVTMLTNANGNYLFNFLNTDGFVANGDSTRGLLATGSYRLTETQPDAYLDGIDTAGDASDAPGVVQQGTGGSGHGADEITDTRIGPVQDAVGYNFGELLPSSISGSVHEDLNGNGKRETGEPGIAGSIIMLTGKDFYGRTVSLTTTTDANGNYKFEGLYASDATGYTLSQLVQPAGFNDGLEGAGTAGGFANVEFISSIVLGYNEDATDYTFGEVRIPPPKEKPKPKMEVEPEEEVTVLNTYFYDFFENFLPYGQDDDEEKLDYLLDPPEEGILPILPVVPIYSGHAEPGSTIVVEIKNVHGATIGTETVVADAGGNWMAKFPSNIVYDTPTTVTETVTRPTYAQDTENSFNLRTFFSSAINPSHFFTKQFDVNTVISDMASNRMEVMQQAHEGSQNFDWDGFNYEFLTEPGVPSS